MLKIANELKGHSEVLLPNDGEKPTCVCKDESEVVTLMSNQELECPEKAFEKPLFI